MKLIPKSLTFKIGAIIILAEILILLIVGVILMNQLSPVIQQDFQRSEIINLFLLSGLLIVSFTAIALYVTFRWLIFNRLTAVITILKSAEAGDLHSRLPEPIAADEVGQLQKGLNALIAQLEDTVTELTDNIADLRMTENGLAPK